MSTSLGETRQVDVDVQAKSLIFSWWPHRRKAHTQHLASEGQDAILRDVLTHLNPGFLYLVRVVNHVGPNEDHRECGVSSIKTKSVTKPVRAIDGSNSTKLACLRWSTHWQGWLAFLTMSTHSLSLFKPVTLHPFPHYGSWWYHWKPEMEELDCGPARGIS